jgi:hypothetical protein
MSAKEKRGANREKLLEVRDPDWQRIRHSGAIHFIRHGSSRPAMQALDTHLNIQKVNLLF